MHLINPQPDPAVLVLLVLYNYASDSRQQILLFSPFMFQKNFEEAQNIAFAVWVAWLAFIQSGSIYSTGDDVHDI